MKNSELLKEQTTAQQENSLNSSNKEEIVKQEQIGDSPFKYVEIKNNKYVALGHNLLKEVKSKTEAMHLVETRDWELMLTTTALIVENYNKK